MLIQSYQRRLQAEIRSKCAQQDINLALCNQVIAISVLYVSLNRVDS